MNDSTKIVIPKSDRSEIHVDVSEFKGKRYLGIREWFIGRDGVAGPSRKGVSIPMDLADDAFRAISQVLAEFKNGEAKPEAAKRSGKKS